MTERRARQRTAESDDATAQVKRVFVDALGIDGETDFEALAYAQGGKWDSVAHMALVVDLEAAFDITLDADDVVGMSTYPMALEILRRHDVPV